MNLPNKLTLTRIVLVPVFMIFVSLTSLDAVANGTFQPLYYCWPALFLQRPASPTFWTVIWPASGTWSPTLASLPTRWPTSC